MKILLVAAFWQSLVVRITLLSFAVILTSLWSLAWYVGSEMRGDLQDIFREQQRANVTAHAQEIERELAERMDLLQSFGTLAEKALARDPASLQQMMTERPALLSFFNAGFFVTDVQGTAIASMPLDIPRTGVNYMENDNVASAIKLGKSTIGEPIMGKVLKTPVLSIAVPMRNAQGQVMGALVGVIELSKPNFLADLMADSHGASGNMLLIAQPWNVVVFSTVKKQLLQGPSQLGLGTELSSFVKEPDGTTTLTDMNGTEVLASSSNIALANWKLVATLPTADAFAPANRLMRNMALATAAATLFCTFLIAWLMRRQLAPVHTAHQALMRQSGATQGFEPLPRSRNDEIGQLIDGFNHLLGEVTRREAALAESEHKLHGVAQSLHEAQQISHMGSWALDLVHGKLHWSEEVFRIFELDPAHFGATYEAFLDAVHPDDRKAVNANFSNALAARTQYEVEHRILMTDGRIKWVFERCRTEFDPAGTPIRAVGTVQDVTERKAAETALTQSRDLLLTIVETIPMRIFWKDHRLTYMGCNTLFAADAGKQSPADLLGRDDYSMVWAAQADLYRADDFAVMASGLAKLFYDEPQTTPDGSTIWLRTSKIPLKNADGETIGVLGLYEDITERKMAEIQLRKLSLVAEQSPESILITDLNGSIEYVNESFTRKSGFSREEVMGKNPRLLLHSDKISAVTYKAMWAALRACETWSGELISKRKDGATYTDWAIITPLRAPDGKVTHYVAIQEDITERLHNTDELERYRHGLEALVAQRTEELTSARQQADAANRSKSEFLANMSHEIRTPMNGVIGMVDVLRKTALNAEQARMLDTVQKSSQALLTILNDILDFSKIEAGKLEIEQVPTQLQGVVENVVQLLEHTASAKRVTVVWSMDPQLPEWVLSDPTRLRQILLNLLGNAIKFVAHDTGRVEVSTHAVTRGDGSAGMQIQVIDNGIGMDHDVLARLFRPFTQGDASTVRKYGGTGLGLSITQRLVQMLHGQLTVSSTPGQGSAFTVELPLSISTPADHSSHSVPPQAAVARADQAQPDDRIILVAEDNETNRDVVLEQLRLLGYRSEFAEDGVQALAMWRSGRYSLLLTDCHMPNMDGFELTEAIRSTEADGAHTPIIAITANAMQGEAQRCKDHGMDDYLSKPLRMDELARMLDQWLHGAHTPVPGQQTQDGPAGSATAPSHPAWDPDALGRLVGDNPEMHSRLLAKFLVNAENQIQAMRTASGESNLRLLADVAHTLKSAARTVGAMALGEHCQAIETTGRAGDLLACITLAQALPEVLAQATQAINRE